MQFDGIVYLKHGLNSFMIKPVLLGHTCFSMAYSFMVLVKNISFYGMILLNILFWLQLLLLLLKSTKDLNDSFLMNSFYLM